MYVCNKFKRGTNRAVCDDHAGREAQGTASDDTLFVSIQSKLSVDAAAAACLRGKEMAQGIQ